MLNPFERTAWSAVWNAGWRSFAGGACLLSLLLLTGCGPSGLTVAGVVTVDGQPVEKGKLSLVPQAGVDSPTAMVPIQDGEFQVPGDLQLRKGEFDVKVSITPDREPPPEETKVDPKSGNMGAMLAQAMANAPPPDESFQTNVSIDESTSDLKLEFTREK